MAKKRKRGGATGGGGKGGSGKRGGRRKPNHSLPSDDHLDIKPIRRTKREQEHAELARLLTHNLDLFSSKERKAAVLTAYTFGASFAEDAYEDGEDEACGDETDYRRVCVRYAYMTMKVINDVEYMLWKSASPDDIRFHAFRMGFDDRMSEIVQAA